MKEKIGQNNFVILYHLKNNEGTIECEYFWWQTTKMNILVV